jgi:hypothetical protein
MRVSLLLALMGAFKVALIANPIAIDSERRYIDMVAERVAVDVKSDHSQVTGEYVFLLGKDFTPDIPDTYVEISVPVILKQKDAPDYTVKWSGPKLRVKNQTITCHHREQWNPIEPRSDDHVEYFVARLPLKMLSQRFELHLTYTQPHLPGRVAAYLPMLPPSKGLPAEVCFQATQGMRLRRVSGWSLFGPKTSQISFTPQDRKMLRVKAFNE